MDRLAWSLVALAAVLTPRAAIAQPISTIDVADMPAGVQCPLGQLSYGGYVFTTSCEYANDLSHRKRQWTRAYAKKFLSLVLTPASSLPVHQRLAIPSSHVSTRRPWSPSALLSPLLAPGSTAPPKRVALGISSATTPQARCVEYYSSGMLDLARTGCPFPAFESTTRLTYTALFCNHLPSHPCFPGPSYTDCEGEPHRLGGC